MKFTNFDETGINRANSEGRGGIQLPTNFTSVGSVENNHINIYIKQSVYKKIQKLSSSDTTKEHGCILIGDYLLYGEKVNVVVSDIIKIKYADTSVYTLALTNKTWDYIYEQLERKHSDKKIVGWQHSHNGTGISLSDYDMFVQSTYFNMDYQIIYVVDPLQNAKGFYQWENGELINLNGYYVYEDIGKPIIIYNETNSGNTSGCISKSVRFSYILLAGALAIIVALAIYSVLTSIKYKTELDSKNILAEQTAHQQMIIDQQSSDIEYIKDILKRNDFSTDGMSGIEELINKLDARDNITDKQRELKEELKSFVNNYKASNSHDAKLFNVYTIKSGDTIESICNESGLDFYEYRNLIYSINGIEDPTGLDVGQIILLPAY